MRLPVGVLEVKAATSRSKPMKRSLRVVCEPVLKGKRPQLSPRPV